MSAETTGCIAAGIDIGTNAVKSVVARVDGGLIAEVLHEDRQVTRLGEGVHTNGRLSPAAIMRTCQAITAMAEEARARGAGRIRAGATSAAREASNTAELIRCVREACGVEVEIMPGEEEARLSYLAISSKEPDDEQLAVIDPGGGSTEWVLGRGRHIEARHSAPVGAVRVTERWLPGDPPALAAMEQARREIARAFSGVPDARGRRLVGTGGTLRNMASVYSLHAGVTWDEARNLPRTEVERQISEYGARTIAQRRSIPGLEPDRADIILGGALVILACCDHSAVNTVYVTDLGLRHGLVLSAGSM